MKFASQPVNMEASGGGALRVSVALSGAPAESDGADFAIWAARLPEPLSPAALSAMACGIYSVSANAIRQDGPNAGLRQAGGLSVSYGANGAVTLEGSLFNPLTDMPPRTQAGPSWDVLFQPMKERSDGPWILAATACLPGTGGGSPTAIIAKGGLDQWEGQEHLAGVHLGPSDLAPAVEMGQWLESTIRSLKPVLDARMARVAGGRTLSRVVFTEEEKGDGLLSVYIIPKGEKDDADGLAAPDRRGLRPSFTIRGVAYGDDPAAKVRCLTQLMGTLKQELNTRKLREGILPSGLQFSLAFAKDMEFGQTEGGWDDACDLTWECLVIQTGVF